VADAEIIPLGTRGRPGRGTGADKPSANSRNLAGGPAPRRTGASRVGTEEVHVPRSRTPVEPDGARTVPGGSAEPTRQPSPTSGERVDEQSQPIEPDAPTAISTRTPVTTDHRHPGRGIPPVEWLSAFTGAAKELFGERWEPRLAEFLAFLRRRLTGDFVVDDYGFDQEITQQFLLAALRPIAEKWFRVELRGTENLPAEGGALVVSNHSGTLPLDGLMTAVSIQERTGRFLRPLGADLVFRLPLVGDLARKGGATLACIEDAERMLRDGELVGVWPEGFKGIGKPFSERYKLQRFGRGGFVSAAIRTGVPIVPVSVVGAEEIYPLVGNIPSLARLLGIPYLPITPFFPLLGPLGLIPLPSKWLIEFGEPIRTDEYDEGSADDPMLVFNVTDQVRESIQQTLYSLLMQRKSVFS